MVAHRLSTVKNCDKIFFLSKGKIKDYGTFDELNLKSELFKLFSKKCIKLINLIFLKKNV